MPDVDVEGPDGKTYQFPDGTDKAAAIKYFKAKGIGVSKPAGDKQAAAPTTVPKDFLERTGERLGGNLKQPVEAGLAAVDAGRRGDNVLQGAGTLSQAGEKLLYPWGHSVPAKVAGSITAPVRAMYGQAESMVKDWWKDPANLAGDVAAGYIAHQASTGTGSHRPMERLAPSQDHPHISTPAPHPSSEITPEQWSKHIDNVNKAYHEHAEAMGDYAQKEAQRSKAHAQKTYNAKKSVADGVAATNQRNVLDRASTEYTDLAQKNIRAVHQTVRSRLDSRWHDFREKMTGSTVDAIRIGKVIQEARTKLRGSPADLKQFNDLVKESGVEVNDDGEIEVKEGKPTAIPLDTARVHSSAIGDKLAAGDLPGSVYQALKTAKEGIEGTIEETADSYDQGDTYRALKRDWSQYMRDWNDMRSVAGGKGSVLARALRVPDTKFLRPLTTGSGGDLLLETLGKYRDAGANPELVSNARKLARQAKQVKVPRELSLPPGYEPGPAPKLREVPVPKPEPAKLAKAKKPFWRKAARVAGGVATSTASSAVGIHHPIASFVMGGEAGERIYDKFTGTDKPAVPPGMYPPRQQ